MKGRKPQGNNSDPDGVLDSSPFSQLLGRFPEAPVPAADKSSPITPALSFRVGRTKKGGYPIFVEKWSAGKTVTVVRNVFGDAEALLTLLKKRCAAGGRAFEDSLEVQGGPS